MWSRPWRRCRSVSHAPASPGAGGGGRPTVTAGTGCPSLPPRERTPRTTPAASHRTQRYTTIHLNNDMYIAFMQWHSTDYCSSATRHTRPHIHIHTFTCTHRRTETHAHKQTHTYTHGHIQIHTCTETQIHNSKDIGNSIQALTNSRGSYCTLSSDDGASILPTAFLGPPSGGSQ